MTCDYPNCPDYATQGICGNYNGDPYPSQWCEEHYQFIRKQKSNWICKFQKGKITGLPEEKRTVFIQGW